MTKEKRAKMPLEKTVGGVAFYILYSLGHVPADRRAHQRQPFKREPAAEIR